MRINTKRIGIGTIVVLLMFASVMVQPVLASINIVLDNTTVKLVTIQSIGGTEFQEYLNNYTARYRLDEPSGLISYDENTTNPANGTNINISHVSTQYNFYPEISRNTVLNETQHTGTNPHTLSIVRPNISGQWNGHTYWAYVGERDWGKIDLMWSEDLITFTNYNGNPIISGNNSRWPSVVFDNGTIWMTFSREYSTVKVRQALWSSTNGINFREVKNLTARQTSGGTMQNSFLFRDPVSSNWYLYWHHGDDNGKKAIWYGIFVRESPTVQGLDVSPDIELFNISGVFAAPSMFYANGLYWFEAEGKELNNNWTSEAYTSTSPKGNFTPIYKTQIISDDSGCPFPYLERNTLYQAYCHRKKQSDGSSWVVDIIKYNISTLPNTNKPSKLYNSVASFQDNSIINLTSSSSSKLNTNGKKNFSLILKINNRHKYNYQNAYVYSRAMSNTADNDVIVYFNKSNELIANIFDKTGKARAECSIPEVKMQLNTEYQFAYILDNNIGKCYLDGTLISSSAAYNGARGGTNGSIITGLGERYTTLWLQPFDGFLSDVRFYDFTLNVKDLQAINNRINIYVNPISIKINTWNTTGDYRKIWNESSSNHNVITAYTIGDFPVNTWIQINKNGAPWNKYLSNSSGYIKFNYEVVYNDVNFDAILFSGISLKSTNPTVNNVYSNSNTLSRLGFASLVGILLITLGMVTLLIGFIYRGSGEGNLNAFLISAVVMIVVGIICYFKFL